MDHHLLTTLEDEDHGLKQASLGVEAKSQLPLRPAVLVKRLNPEGQVGGLNRVIGQDPMLACAAVYLHAA